MGTVNDKLSYLNITKNEIKNAIEEKGVNIAAYTTFREYANKILDISTSEGVQDKLKEIISDETIQGTELYLANKILEYKNSIKQAIQDKKVDVDMTTPFSQYAERISAINSSGNIGGSYVKRNNYLWRSRMQYTIAYQKTHNLYPDANRLIVCFMWNHKDVQTFKVGGPNNYRVELHTGKLFSSNDHENVTLVSQTWDTTVSINDPLNDEDSDWNWGFGIASIYMDGSVYDQNLTLAGQHPSYPYLIADGCSVNIAKLDGVGESYYLDSVNNGKWVISTDEDVAALNRIKPIFIKGLVIEYNNLSNLFPDSVKYLSIDKIITTETNMKLPVFLEEIENIEIVKEAGLKPPQWRAFFFQNGTYLGETLTISNDELAQDYLQKSNIEISPKIIFDGNNDASNLFDSCWNLKHIQSIEFKKCTDYDLSSMFSRCYSLICPEIFDTSLAKNMSWMFCSCYSLEIIPLYNTSNVENMASMFDGCYSLKSVPALDLSNVTNADGMFGGCRSLEQVHLINIGVDLDLSSSTKFATESLIEVLNNLKAGVTKLLVLGNTNLAKLSDDQKEIATNKGWILL